MSEEEIKKYYSFFCEIWKYFKKYAEKDLSDTFWNEASKEGDKLLSILDTEMTRAFIVEAQLELERIKN